MKRTACVVVALAAVTAAGDLSLHQHPGHGPGYAQRALRGSTCDAACEDAQQAALESLFHNLDGSQWKRKDGWTDTSGPCTLQGTSVPAHCCWEGVLCCVDPTSTCVPDNAVTKLDFADAGLRGSTDALASSLSAVLMGTLIVVDLSNNDITGAIAALDSVWSSASKLQTVSIADNHITGDASTSTLFTLATLLDADVGNNMLTGTLPTAPASLRSFNAASNSIAGAVPPSLFCGAMEILVVDDNFLDSLPAALPCSASGLRVLSMRLNNFAQDIPDWMLFQLPDIVSLDLSFNSLTGSIVTFSVMPHLESVNLMYNSLAGALPKGSDGPFLSTLLLSGNQFSGTLDGVFDNFAQLTTVKLSGNALTGPLPAVLGTMQSLGQMDFLGNLMRHEGPRNSRGELLPEWLTYDKYAEETSLLDQDDIRCHSVTLAGGFASGFTSWWADLRMDMNATAACTVSGCRENPSLERKRLLLLHDLRVRLDPGYHLYEKCWCQSGAKLRVTVPEDTTQTVVASCKSEQGNRAYVAVAAVLASVLGVALAVLIVVWRWRAQGQSLRLPDKAATVLVTDMEGSTELWEWNAMAMETAQAVHDAVMRRVLRKHRGFELFTEGDSFSVAFHQTIDAVRCAWEVQAALLAAPWPPELLKHPACAEVYSSAAAGGHVLFRGIRVRMGIARGTFSRTKLNGKLSMPGPLCFSGTALPLATAVQAMGHGGQILVTRDCHEDVVDNLRDLDVFSRTLLAELPPEFKSPDPATASQPSRTAHTPAIRDSGVKDLSVAISGDGSAAIVAHPASATVRGAEQAVGFRDPTSRSATAGQRPWAGNHPLPPRAVPLSSLAVAGPGGTTHRRPPPPIRTGSGTSFVDVSDAAAHGRHLATTPRASSLFGPPASAHDSAAPRTPGASSSRLGLEAASMLRRVASGALESRSRTRSHSHSLAQPQSSGFARPTRAGSGVGLPEPSLPSGSGLAGHGDPGASGVDDSGGALAAVAEGQGAEEWAGAGVCTNSSTTPDPGSLTATLSGTLNWIGLTLGVRTGSRTHSRGASSNFRASADAHPIDHACCSKVVYFGEHVLVAALEDSGTATGGEGGAAGATPGAGSATAEAALTRLLRRGGQRDGTTVTSVYQVLPRWLLTRTAHFPPLSSTIRVSNGFPQAPLAKEYLRQWAGLDPPRPIRARVTICFAAIHGWKTVAGRSSDPNVLVWMFNSTGRSLLSLFGGTECRQKDEVMLLAFYTERGAIEWALMLGEMLSCVGWPPDLYRGPETFVRGPFGASHALRARVGIYAGVPSDLTVHPVSGRAEYFGPVVNRAARLCHGLVAPGEVLVEETVAKAAMAAWGMGGVASVGEGKGSGVADSRPRTPQPTSLSSDLRHVALRAAAIKSGHSATSPQASPDARASSLAHASAPPLPTDTAQAAPPSPHVPPASSPPLPSPTAALDLTPALAATAPLPPSPGAGVALALDTAVDESGATGDVAFSPTAAAAERRAWFSEDVGGGGNGGGNASPTAARAGGGVRTSMAGGRGAAGGSNWLRRISQSLRPNPASPHAHVSRASREGPSAGGSSAHRDSLSPADAHIAWLVSIRRMLARGAQAWPERQVLVRFMGTFILKGVPERLGLASLCLVPQGASPQDCDWRPPAPEGSKVRCVSPPQHPAVPPASVRLPPVAECREEEGTVDVGDARVFGQAADYRPEVGGGDRAAIGQGSARSSGKEAGVTSGGVAAAAVAAAGVAVAGARERSGLPGRAESRGEDAPAGSGAVSAIAQSGGGDGGGGGGSGGGSGGGGGSGSADVRDAAEVDCEVN